MSDRPSPRKATRMNRTRIRQKARVIKDGGQDARNYRTDYKGDSRAGDLLSGSPAPPR